VKLHPWGLGGGGPGALGEYILERADGEIRRLPSKCTVPLERGDKLIIRTPGGGGYGDPLKRDPDLVLRDFLNGLVSIDAAQKDYGVVIDDENRLVLAEPTEELRRTRKVK
jgi:N-methylhydantoinase B